jgi:hypothetical protein
MQGNCQKPYGGSSVLCSVGLSSNIEECIYGTCLLFVLVCMHV